MTFSPNNIDTLSVIIAKSVKDIDSFFDESIEDASGLVLSTGNGNLIQFEHSFGAGIGPDQEVMVRFADSGGETLQSLFSLNINSLVEKSKVNSEQDLFLISYGMGPNRQDWSEPGYHYIYNADYEILSDGLEITTLHFSPSVIIQEDTEPIVSTEAITKAFRENVSQVVGKVDDTGAYHFNDMDEVINSVLNLYRKGAEQVFGLNAVIEVPKEFLKEYLNRELTEAPPTGPNNLGTDGVGGSAALPEFAAWNVNVDDSSIIYDILDGVPMIAGWHESKVKALTTLLQLPGIVLTAEDVPVALPAGPTVPPVPSVVSPPPAAPAGASVPDVNAATTTVVTAPPTTPPVEKSLVINLSVDFRRYREGFANVFSKFFDSLRAAGAYTLTLQNADMWEYIGETLVLLQPTIFIQNNAKILNQLEIDGLIPPDSSKNSLVIMGDVTTILDKFGAIGTGEAQVIYDMSYNEDINSEAAKLKPFAKKPLILETSKNILNFKSDTRLPAIGFFKNNTFYKEANKSGTKEEYINFIKNYLKGSVERFSEAEKLILTNGATDVYDYDQVAEDLFNRLNTLDASALGNSFISTDTKYAGLLTYLYMYYNYVALGTIFGTATTLPYFSYSHPGVIGTNVLVKIRRNPSPYDHIIDKEYNSYNSGLYKLQGFKHSISNAVATSTFFLRRISLK